MAEKKYVIDNAELMAEWNWEKNTEFDPNQLTIGSHKNVWWKCQKGHEWPAIIKSRNLGRGCPYCSGRYAIRGENDLQTINPILAKEWNYEKNNGLTPMDVLPNSGKKVWWKCQKGHEWPAYIYSRNIGQGCPYCSGRYAIRGENDLQTINPTLAKEWNYEKNNGLTPMDVLPNSHKKVWWKCQKGHEWPATINSRNNGHGCPYCTGYLAIKGENDLQTINPILAKEWNYEKNNGLTPMDVLPNSDKKVWWICSKGHTWPAKVSHRTNGRGCPSCNSGQKTSFPEYAIVYYLRKYGLDTIHTYNEKGYELDVYIPSKKIAIEYDGHRWHKDKAKEDLKKNQKCKKDGITLYRIREGLPPLNDSSIDFIIHKDQKDFSKTLKDILSEIIGLSVDIDLGRDCIAIESIREYFGKENSLLYSNPKIANEWNYAKNGNLKPEFFSVNCNKKFWWICHQKHEWKATISHRNNGTGCPYCAGNKVLKGFNDLQTANPSLAKEWNYKKNTNLIPTEVTPNSNKKVWWMCSKGHEWEQTINNRNKGCGCPYCSSRKVLKGYNDLETVNPTLAKNWHYDKNNGLTPADVMPNSNKKVWWKCSEGHEWQARIIERNRGNSCPYCSSRKVLKGYNDLETANPTLTKDWHSEKNNNLTPANVMPNSNKKVWWKCSEGHEWQARIADRNKGRGCPICRKDRKR